MRDCAVFALKGTFQRHRKANHTERRHALEISMRVCARARVVCVCACVCLWK